MDVNRVSFRSFSRFEVEWCNLSDSVFAADQSKSLSSIGEGNKGSVGDFSTMLIKGADNLILASVEQNNRAIIASGDQKVIIIGVDIQRGDSTIGRWVQCDSVW